MVESCYVLTFNSNTVWGENIFEWETLPFLRARFQINRGDEEQSGAVNNTAPVMSSPQREVFMVGVDAASGHN